MDYILAVMSKYLQMQVAYSIYKENPDQVADHFEHFNEDFDLMCKAFKEVTNQTFQAGREVEMLKPVKTSTDSQLAEETERRLHLGETQGSGSRWLNKTCALIISTKGGLSIPLLRGSSIPPNPTYSTTVRYPSQTALLHVILSSY